MRMMAMMQRSCLALAMILSTFDMLTVSASIVEICKTSLPRVVCINRYASVLPGIFDRPTSNSTETYYDFTDTTVPSEKSFGMLNESDFLVFDHSRGLDVLGSSPKYDFMFSDLGGTHEAPAYVPSQKKIYLAKLEAGYLPQESIDLSTNPPTFSTRVQTEPPVYAPAGGFFYKGLIYLVSCGGSTNLSFGGGVPQYPGIYTWDPQTGQTQALLNNYFGLQFNTLDDLFVHPVTGDVWFTHNLYSWIVGRTAFSTMPPQLGPAVYRFNNATGRVFIIEDTLSIPNGISLSPDQKTVYIGDSGAVAGNVDPSQPPGLTFDTLGKRTIYAYDVGGNGTYLSNRRAVYQTQDLVPDTLKVAANGYLVTISGRGADVVDPQGDLLVRVQTNFTVENLVFAGEGLNELWLTGTEAIARVRWALQGQQPVE